METINGEWYMKGCRHTERGCLHSPDELLEMILKRVSPIAEKRGIEIHLETMRQVTAEVLQDLRGCHGTAAVEICHLSHGMDTGIGAAAAADLNGFSQNP